MSGRSSRRAVRHRSGPSPGKNDGFNLVILMMSVTVLNILLALALPAYSTQVQREKEAELIFRGLQYAEALRVFQKQNNRLPTQMRELIEVEPRSIRQLWTNPMDEEGRWCQLPAQGQPGGQNLQNVQNNRNNRNNNQNPGNRNDSGTPQPGPLGEPLDPGQPKCPPGSILVKPPKPGELDFNPAPSMPFVGVSSPVGGSAFRAFMGSEEISEWKFTMEVVGAMQTIANTALAVPVNSKSFWKPFPPGVTPPNPAQQPQAQNPGRGVGPNGRPQNLGGNVGRNQGRGAKPNQAVTPGDRAMQDNMQRLRDRAAANKNKN